MKRNKSKKALSLWEEKFVYDDGSVLAGRVDMPGFQSRQQDYFNALLVSRSLPNNSEALSPKDPIVTYYTQQLKKKLEAKTATMDTVIRQVRGFYEKELTQAKTDSTILALFDTDETEISEREPQPYPEAESAGVRWTIKAPTIIRDLSDPAEAMLKVIYDLFVEKPNVAAKILEMAEQLAVRMNMIEAGLIEVNEAGFLSAATSAAVGEAVDALVLSEDDQQPASA